MRGARSSMPRTRPAPASAGVIRFAGNGAQLADPAGGLLVEGVLDQFGVDPAEVGDAGAGAVRGELDPQRAAQRLDPRLGDGVGGVAHAVDEGVDGGDDDHLAAALDDLRQRRPDRAPDAEQVDLEDAFPFLAGDPRAVANCFWAMPALATATSSPPNFSTTSATAANIALWSVTSA